MVVGQLEEAADLVVVGAGPGGYAAALRGAQLGRKVTLIERDGAEGVGGVCLRIGCIPSKALIEAAELNHKARHAADFGVNAQVGAFDMKRFQAWKSEVMGGLTNGVRSLLAAADVDIVEGTFRFTDADKAVVTPSEGQARFLAFKDLVLATGSRPAALEDLPFDGGAVLDSTGALALTALPETMAVIGAGYIGLEIGTAFAKLGVAVTIVEAEARLLPTMDAALSRPLAGTLKALGVDVRLSARAQGHEDGKLVLAGGETVAAENLVVAVGRRPNTDDLGLADAHIETDGRGLVTVAADRRAAPHVAAIGDITDGHALAHKATAEASVAAEALSGRRTAFTAQAVPAVVFTDPEIATVGLSADDAAAAGIEARAARFPLSASGRASTLGRRGGFLQLVADRQDGRVVGVHVVGPHASELIGEGALAIEMGATLEDLALTIHAHPTLGELYSEASLLALGRPLNAHLPAKR